MIDQVNFNDCRHERKFLIKEFSNSDIENIIKSNSAIFFEIYKPRQVNNIYLDTIDLKNYHDNIAGNTNRLKIRIRWYGKSFGHISKPVLEFKIKKGEIGKKISFPLKSFNLDKKLSKENLMKSSILKSNLPLWAIESLKSMDLVLLNSYLREYFISADKIYRLTLDSDLTFIEVNNLNNSFKNLIKDENTFILELKYSPENDIRKSQITQSFPFRLSKSSKYISGMNLLNDL